MINETYLKNFLKYISFDTQSDESSDTCPSTAKQRLLGEALVEELHNLGIDNAFIDQDGYVYGVLEANVKTNGAVGLIAHMDTSDEASGKDVKPQIIHNYDGRIIEVNKELGIILDPKVFPVMKTNIGHTIITTDGTTLLGADDKSGVAIIMTTIEEIIKENLPHPTIMITFTPDEEIGRGADRFNVKYYHEHNCYLAYTIDGGSYNVIEYENFNAASCKVTITGKSIHPGSAKDKMINSQILAMEFFNKLPELMRPEHTEGYEGFNHLTEINGTTSKTVMHFIIRNHDMVKFNEQKDLFNQIALELNNKYGEKLFNVEIKDSYYNMKEKVALHPEVLSRAVEAFKDNGIEPTFEAIRGGTDGARLSFEGITTPNLGTGGQNYHGPFEYVDVNEASIMVKVLKTLVQKYQ